MSNLHDGHRDRLRNRYIEFGAKAFEDHELLELLLFYATPRKDTNPLAHSLIDKYGSLKSVLDADVKHLAEEPDMSDSKALLLNLVVEMGRRYFMSKNTSPAFSTVGQAANYITPMLFALKSEEFHMFCLDISMRILGHQRISEGSIESVPVDKRKVVSYAISTNASYVILAHNHPNGSVRPSRADIELTKQLAEILSPIGIGICDHIITSGKDFYSFSRHGAFSAETDTEMLFAEQY